MEIKSDETILVVEDTKADFIRIERSLKKARLINPLIHIPHGDDAMDYLSKSGKYEVDPAWVMPALVLLDINLPGSDGFQILKKTKESALVCQIPIIMMTTSSDSSDVNRCYQAGANSYIVKPFSSKGFFEAMEKIRDYWFSLVVLPDSKRDV